MPARVSSRSARTTSGAVSHRSSAATLNSRPASRASRYSTPYTDVPEETACTELRTQICAIFSDAQRTTVSHRKLAVNLRKIQEACCYEPTNPKKKTVAEEFDEDQFNYEIGRCVLRVMPVKKSESVGEKVIKFFGLFLRHATEKDNELNATEDETEILVETPSTRLTTHVMSAVLPLLTAKEKFVRFRSTQLISHITNSLDSLDDDLFQMLRHGLLKRIHDKEAMVRVQAVLGLGRLAGNEVGQEANSDESDDDSTGGLLEKLLQILQNDPSADVRRTLLTNLPILQNTLPFLLEKARDQDPATRRALYSRLLPALGDFRHLSLSMREKLLRWGLRDRDENVRKAAGRLFRERWIEDCASSAEPSPEGEGADGESRSPSFDGLLELLERIDIVNSGVENGVALEAMKDFWEGRPDYREAVVFDENFWNTLSAESAFLARSWNDYCRAEGNRKFEALVEEKMPEVTKLAFFLERYLDVLVEAMKRIASQGQNEEEEEEDEEDTTEQDFIVEQLLHIAQTLDYSDEVGRRKMFTLLRQSLAIPDLPEEVTKLVVEVLRGICAGDASGEKEFISVVLEAVGDVHDTIMDEPAEEVEDDESFHSARSEVSDEGTPTGQKRKASEPLDEEAQQEKAIREIMVNMKCLHIVQCMLENVEVKLQENVDLSAMVDNLVVPAVRSHEAPVRERGLLCLGLCCLLDKSLTEQNMALLLHFFSKGHSALQVTSLKILTDLLTRHGSQLIDTSPLLLKAYLKALKSGVKTPDVQATATIAVCKLMLGRIIQDSDAANELLKTLIVLYFDPSTQANQGVRQALTYFLPVYSFSRAENQDRVRSVAMDVIHLLFNIHESRDDDVEESEGDMISLSTIGAHLVDWTDPRKCYVAGNTTGLDLDAKVKAVNGDVHLVLAQDILERLDGNASKEEKKILAPLLAKLHISPASSEEKLKGLYAEVSAAVDDKLVVDATGRNALYKIHVSLGKIVNALAGKEKSRKITFGESLRSSERDGVAPEGSLRSSVAPEVSLRGSVAPSLRSVSAAPSHASMTSTTGRSATPEEVEKTKFEDIVMEEAEDETTIQQVLPQTRKRNTTGKPDRAGTKKPKEESEGEDGNGMDATMEELSFIDELLSDEDDDDDTVVS